MPEKGGLRTAERVLMMRIAPLDDDLEHLLFGDFPGFFIHSSCR